MQKVFRCIQRWWFRLSIHQCNEDILQHQRALRKNKGSAGEHLAQIALLRKEMAHCEDRLEALE